LLTLETGDNPDPVAHHLRFAGNRAFERAVSNDGK
jgi:hypothetical protein